MRRTAMGLTIIPALAVVAVLAGAILAGCSAGGSETNRARLIAIENRKLTQQVQEQTQQIAQLEAELERVKQESHAHIEQLNKATGEIMGPLMQMQQELQAENERLKKQLEQQ